MAGLIEEGEEVIEEGEEQDDVAADLALIAAAQKVEHYEISGYGTARTMAGQTGLPAVAAAAEQVAGGGRDRRQPAHADRARADVRGENRHDQGAQTRQRDRGDRRLVAHHATDGIALALRIMGVYSLCTPTDSSFGQTPSRQWWVAGKVRVVGAWC